VTLETRNGNRYYYRSAREGEKVRKVYVGSGRLAELRAEADRAERGRLRAERGRERDELGRLEALAAPVLEMGEAAEEDLRGHLLAGGCHRHKGEWRRARIS
jgi:hypothetical protein